MSLEEWGQETYTVIGYVRPVDNILSCMGFGHWDGELVASVKLFYLSYWG